MKRQIRAFEEIQGKKQLDVRRAFNARQLGLYDPLDPLVGGQKLGEGLEKCVYDSNDGLECLSRPIPALPSTEVNIVLTEKAYQEEKEIKRRIVEVVDPVVIERTMVTMQDQPVCRHALVPPECTSRAGKAGVRRVLVRAPRGSTSKKFGSLREFGVSFVNLLYGLFAMHAHDLVHGDVKIHPNANNIVRIGKVYKLIDFGFVTTFKEFVQAIVHPKSSKGRHLMVLRKYQYAPVGQVYPMMHAQDFVVACRVKGISQRRVLKILFENMDMTGLVRSLAVLHHANPALHLGVLLKYCFVDPNKSEEFASTKRWRAHQVVQACTTAVLNSGLDVGKRHAFFRRETYRTLPEIYAKTREYCELTDLPATIEEYAKL